jgi:hypothetical protein
MRNYTVMNHSVEQRLIYFPSIYSLRMSNDRPIRFFFGSTCDRAVAVPTDANTDRVVGDGVSAEIAETLLKWRPIVRYLFRVPG